MALTYSLNAGGTSYSVVGNSCTAGAVTIPSTHNGLPVTSIGISAFFNCTSLTSVTIGNSVTSIGQNAFYLCTSLASVTIPNSVTSIGISAFFSCTALTSITIPDSVTSIGISAFSDCTSLTSVTIGNSVTSIGRDAFYLCTSLTSVTFAPTSSVTSIGNYVFAYCISLASVTIPNSVTSIGVSAFSDCTSLTSVTIGNSVTSIGNYVFAYCTSLTRVNFLGNAPTLGTDVFLNTNVNLKVYRYSTKSGWSSIFGGEDVLLIDTPSKGLRTFGFPNISSGKISIKKQNLGGGRIKINKKNYILNSRFDADNQYPIADGTQFFDSNYYLQGNCGDADTCTILTNYRHNSPLLYTPVQFNYPTYANRTFHEINAPYDTLPIGHPIQPRLLKMFGAGSKFGRSDNLTNYLKTITNTTSFSPSDAQSWTKYGVEQMVIIPSWATKVVYGVKYLAKSDDLFRDNNFAGLKLNFRSLFSPDPYIAPHRNYVNVHLIRRSTAAAVDTLESLYGSNVYLYFDADLGSNAMCQWLGPNVSRVKVRKRSSTIIDSNTNQFIEIEDTIDIPTFSSSGGEPDFGDGRPDTVSLEMFFAEWVNYFVSSGPNGTSSGSIYFYEPFIYFV